jgi:hypothetical protein
LDLAYDFIQGVGRFEIVRTKHILKITADS